MTIDIDRVLESIQDDEQVGFCINCGEERSGCEPDARKYECEGCGKSAVYGAEELILMGIPSVPANES